MKQLKFYIKLILYGWLLDYHLSWQNRIDSRHKTVLNYHCEMSQYYYKKIYGEEWRSKQ